VKVIAAIAGVVSLGAPLSAAPVEQPPSAEMAVEGTRIGFAVSFGVGVVQFAALVPKGWQFSVQVDGDQDGKWGVLEGIPTKPVDRTEDRQYALTADNQFCPEYIISSIPHIPERVGAATPCGRLPSRGRVEIEGTDDKDRSVVDMKIPTEEVFGDKPTAHVQICIWDTQNWSCIYSPKEPLIIQRPTVEMTSPVS